MPSVFSAVTALHYLDQNSLRLKARGPQTAQLKLRYTVEIYSFSHKEDYNDFFRYVNFEFIYDSNAMSAPPIVVV